MMKSSWAMKDYIFSTLGASAISIVSSLIISNIFPPPEVTGEVQGFFELPFGTVQYITLFILLIVLPLIEELVFRKALWGFLERYLPKRQVLFVVSTIFCLCHIEVPLVVGLLPISLFLGWLRLRTDSIKCSVIAHIAYNTTGIFLTLV